MPDEAWKASAVLGRNYPDTYWYRQSLRLLLAEQRKTGMWTAAGPHAVDTGGGSANAYPERSSTAYPTKGSKAAKPPKAPKAPGPKSNSYPAKSPTTGE
jgi:hypothetical protein